MIKLLTAATVLLLALVASPAGQAAGRSPAARAQDKASTTILVAMDGFRADYLNRGLTPNLRALADKGVRGSLRPSFPSVTLSNFYTIMTGKTPDHHGIVGNQFEDESKVAFGGRLSPDKPETNIKQPAWWRAALPLWASFEAQGGYSAHLYLPSLGVDSAGRPPAHYVRPTEDIKIAAEPSQFFELLDQSPSDRPRFLTLYFYPADHEGHEHGPNSPQLNQGLRDIDAAIGSLMAGLRERGLLDRVNIVLLADHGMAEVPFTQRIVIDEGLAPNTIRPVSLGAYAAIEPGAGVSVDTVAGKLVGRRGHVECWRKEDMPKRFRFGSNPRIAPIICLADNGWDITTRDKAAAARTGTTPAIRGNHGFDPSNPDMTAVFVASGPAFKPNSRLSIVDNVNVYSLLAKLVGVKPEPGDGSIAPFTPALKAD